jgi:uncharacterized protein with HEPN domain
MSRRSPALFLNDILASSTKVLEYTAGMDRGQFFQDSKTYDAVLRNLAIIGEAAKNIPDEIRSKHPEVEWKKMAGLRDIFIHNYFGINEEILWDIIINKIPLLKTTLHEIIQNLSLD